MHLIADLFRKKENKFDYIFSLGYNCEPMFRFVRYFKFEESSIFNWAGFLSVQHLVDTLYNFDSIALNGFSDPTPLYECNNTHIRVHGKFYDAAEDKNEDVIKKDKVYLEEKFAYLKEKFKRILKDDSKKLYVAKIMDKDVDEKQMDALYKAFVDIGANNFKLLFVCQEKALKGDYSAKPYLVRTVKYFASDEDVTNKKYFKNGWDKIFDEFYCTNLKNLKKKKYKFDKEEQNG